MGRMHSNGKGKSRSALPYKRSPPSWLKITPGEVRAAPRWWWRRRLAAARAGSDGALAHSLKAVLLLSSFCAPLPSLQVSDTIAKMAKKGMTPSQIGVILRDSHGIAQVRAAARRWKPACCGVRGLAGCEVFISNSHSLHSSRMLQRLPACLLPSHVAAWRCYPV